MLVLTIIAVIATIVCAIINLFCEKRETEILFLVLSIAWGVFLGMCLIYSEIETQPTAMDVYRGNTRLQINSSVVDGVITKKDSVVVFK